MRKQRIFTGLGDEGKTGLLGEGRFNKSDLIFEVLGSLDELSAVIGVTKSYIKDQSVKDQLSKIQQDLYKIMAELSIADPVKVEFNGINLEDIDHLNNLIQKMSGLIEMPAEFILPGDTIQSANIDLTRTVTRRVERRIIDLFIQKGIGNKMILQFINRLSSYFFILEIKLLHDEGIQSPTLAK